MKESKAKAFGKNQLQDITKNVTMKREPQELKHSKKLHNLAIQYEWSEQINKN